MRSVPFTLFLAIRPDIDRAALDAAFAAANLPAPTIHAAVLRNGQIVWTGRKGASKDVEFRIGSLTKAFTATVVLQLVNERKLALDDPAAKLLPELPKAWKGVTVRQLLNHTSGIPDCTSQPDFMSHIAQRFTPAGIVALTAEKPLDFRPGTQFRYDNTGYVILGMIVERLDRRPFADSLQRRILEPLGLEHTRLNVGGDKPEVAGFQPDGKPAIAINMSLPYAAGSIVSTLGDMAKWMAAQDSPRLLPTDLWAEMEKPGVLADGKATHYGFGWIVGSHNGVPAFLHSGGIPGFITSVERVSSKGLASIVLTNSDGINSEPLAQRLLEAADPSLRASDAAIPDPDPKVTEAAERLFLSLAKGEPDRSLMSEALSKAITPEAVAGGKAFLASQGAYLGMRLVKADGPRRTYLVRYKKGTIKLEAVQDPRGRFSGFAIRPA